MEEATAVPAAVWLDLDQAALDYAYDQRVWAPNLDQLAARRHWLGESARARLDPPLDLPYGAAPVERLQVFRTGRADAPVAIFVHGGAWRASRAADYAFMAELFVRNGAHLAILDFASVTDADGDLAVLADQVRRAVLWIRDHAAEAFGGDPGRLFVSGHSSGAHLASTLLATDWEALGRPADLLKGGVLCSGMYDLRPVRLSKRSTYLAFTDAVEEALSAQRHITHIRAPLVLAYGSSESPEFQRQARDFAAALDAAGKRVELIRAEHYNHFEMLETFASPYGPVGRAILAQMALAA